MRQHELQRRLSDAIDKLSEDDREIVLMPAKAGIVEVDQCGPRAVDQSLGWTDGSANSYTRSALQSALQSTGDIYHTDTDGGGTIPVGANRMQFPGTQ